MRAPSASLSPETKPQVDALGLTADAVATVGKLIAAGFSCSNSDRVTRCMADGKTAAQILGYPRSVAIMIPNGLWDPKRVGPAVTRFQYFFHGHVVEEKGFFWYLENFRIDSQFADLGMTRTILIVPQSSGECRDFDRFFGKTPKKFDEFNFALMKILGILEEQLTPIALSGHSGSYRVIANLISNQTRTGEPLKNKLAAKINRVGLLDATYGDIPRFQQWAARNGDHRLVVACATNDPCRLMYGIENYGGRILPNVITTRVQPRSEVGIVHYDLGIHCIRNTWESRGC